MSRETIIISPLVKLWLQACQKEVDQASKDYIQRFIDGTESFTSQWYFAMPVRPYFVDGHLATPTSIFRPSIEEELHEMNSGFETK
jgi:hypothetical protein